MPDLGIGPIVLKLRFDGANYCGWQVQKNAVSVQTKLQDAIEATFGERVSVTGCSRTDAGVHANEYVCHLGEGAYFRELKRLPLALNRELPHDIAVLSAQRSAPGFHARYSATGKEYIYVIRNSRIRDPFLCGRVYDYFPRLDAKRLDELAADFVGTKDFASFMGAATPVDDTVRNVFYCGAKRDGDIVTITIAADGFLNNMVRIIVGTLLGVESGRIDMPIPEIFEKKDRKYAGPTSPAHGLYLNRVFYGAEWGLSD